MPGYTSPSLSSRAGAAHGGELVLGDLAHRGVQLGERHDELEQRERPRGLELADRDVAEADGEHEIGVRRAERGELELERAFEVPPCVLVIADVVPRFASALASRAGSPGRRFPGSRRVSGSSVQRAAILSA
jgi:hypothetical protein